MMDTNGSSSPGRGRVNGINYTHDWNIKTVFAKRNELYRSSVRLKLVFVRIQFGIHCSACVSVSVRLNCMQFSHYVHSVFLL